MTSDPRVPPPPGTGPGSFGQPGPGEPLADPSAHGRAPAVKEVKFNRTAALWSSVIGGFVILIILLVFIAQNTSSQEFHFFGWSWSLPLGVAILSAAVGGGLVAVLAALGAG